MTVFSDDANRYKKKRNRRYRKKVKTAISFVSRAGRRYSDTVTPFIFTVLVSRIPSKHYANEFHHTERSRALYNTARPYIIITKEIYAITEPLG